MVIEVDGKIHNVIEVKTNDTQRQQLIEADDIVVIRFKNEEVLKSLETVVTKINLAINNKLFNHGNKFPL